MRIVVCFKDGLMRSALESLLASQSHLDVCASVADAGAALGATKLHGAHLLIIVSDGLLSGDIEALREAKEHLGLRYLVVGDSELETENSALPFDRFVKRSASAKKLFRAIASLADRRTLQRYVLRESAPSYGLERLLTPREQEIAFKVAEGCSNRDIAEDVGLGEQTVKNMVSIVMRKLDCTNRVQVALKLSRKAKSRG